MDKVNTPKSCSTCEHRSGTMYFGKCMLSGFYLTVERQYPTVCGKDFQGWVKRRSLVQRLKDLFSV